jgi:hypothetical protein
MCRGDPIAKASFRKGLQASPKLSWHPKGRRSATSCAGFKRRMEIIGGKLTVDETYPQNSQGGHPSMPAIDAPAALSSLEHRPAQSLRRFHALRTMISLITPTLVCMMSLSRKVIYPSFPRAILPPSPSISFKIEETPILL